MDDGPWVWLRDVTGWRMPIRPGGTLEVFDGARLCYEVDVALLVDLLALHFRTARLTAALQQAGGGPFDRERFTIDLESTRKPLAPPLPGTFTPERRAALRKERRARSSKISSPGA